MLRMKQGPQCLSSENTSFIEACHEKSVLIAMHHNKKHSGGMRSCFRGVSRGAWRHTSDEPGDCRQHPAQLGGLSMV